jgi:hypothetical protein
MLTIDRLDRMAFEKLLATVNCAFEDLQTNDNRSQDRSVERNLDYSLRLRDGRQVLVELEGRQAMSGRVQPSTTWIKGDELAALLAWEAVDHAQRLAVIVFAFRWDTPIEGHACSQVEGLHYTFLAALASNYDRCKKVRSTQWKTYKLPKECFDSVLRPVEEVLSWR